MKWRDGKVQTQRRWQVAGNILSVGETKCPLECLLTYVHMCLHGVLYCIETVSHLRSDMNLPRSDQTMQVPFEDLVLIQLEDGYFSWRSRKRKRMHRADKNDNCECEYGREWAVYDGQVPYVVDTRVHGTFHNTSWMGAANMMGASLPRPLTRVLPSRV